MQNNAGNAYNKNVMLGSIGVVGHSPMGNS